MNIHDAICRATGNDPAVLNEIREAIAKNEAFCFGNDDVRMVLRPRSKNGIPYVVVWLGASTRQDGLIKYLPNLKQLTRMIGGRWAEFYTSRKGFIRVAERLGFERQPDEDGLMKFKIPI
jgi:hypothetical protein